MPNPYHDDQGRFCSAGEMLSTCNRLLLAGKLEEAQKLKTEYDHISQTNLNEGINPEINQKLDIIAKSSAFKGTDANETFAQQLIITNEWTDEELDNVNNAIELYKQRLTEEQKTTVEEVAKLEADYKKKTGTDFKNQSSLTWQQKNEGEQLLNEVRKKIITAGVPEGYADTYVFGRVAAPNGIAHGYDNYKGTRIFAASKLSPVNLEKLPTIRDAKRREIIQNAFNEVFNSEEGKEWNKKAAIINKNHDTIASAGKQHTELVRKVYDAQERLKSYEESQNLIKDIKNWRSQVKETGVSPKAKIVSAGGVKPETIMLNNKSEVVNAWGVNNGKMDRIVRVEELPLGYVGGTRAAKLVGESGKSYYSSVHYANFGRRQSTGYVLVDPTVKGNKKASEAFPTPIVFNYVMDTGD